MSFPVKSEISRKFLKNLSIRVKNGEISEITLTIVIIELKTTSVNLSNAGSSLKIN